MGSMNKKLIKEYNKDEMNDLIVKEVNNFNHEVNVVLKGKDKGKGV